MFLLANSPCANVRSATFRATNYFRSTTRRDTERPLSTADIAAMHGSKHGRCDDERTTWVVYLWLLFDSSHGGGFQGRPRRLAPCSHRHAHCARQLIVSLGCVSDRVLALERFGTESGTFYDFRRAVPIDLHRESIGRDRARGNPSVRPSVRRDRRLKKRQEQSVRQGMKMPIDRFFVRLLYRSCQPATGQRSIRFKLQLCPYFSGIG